AMTRAQLQAARARVQEAEADSERHRLHAATLEKKLYSGEIRLPRELQALQADLEAVQRQRRAAEDAGLEAMLEVEELQAREHVEQAELERLRQAWETEQAELAATRAQLQQTIADLRQQWERQARQIDAEALALYQQLRAKRSVAVARVSQGRCTGCQLAQPATLLARARDPQALVPCASCGRILYLV
ncbi:MAG: hypothetical protein K6T35_06735, partial [Meiothermus silvanus]|nr:hypothetical protein [Allomeiothermus silvanus]